MSSSRGGGRGRGNRGGQERGKAARVESEEQRQAWEARELVEAKKHQLIEFVKCYPCLYDIAHPEHLNCNVTRVLWEEIADKLEVDGKNFIYSNMRKYMKFQKKYSHLDQYE